MARRFIIGIDEVGRGPLAGPITVAAFAVPAIFRRKLLQGIKDSKKLSPKQREEWNKKIISAPSIKIAISSVGAETIDRIGISPATRLAVKRCLNRLQAELERGWVRNDNLKILLDGSLYAPKNYPNQTTIIRGDEKIPVIAAASIVAKVHRDRKMARLALNFPEYGMEVHKGYGTASHIRAIKKHGLSELHRRTFCKNFI